MILPKINCKKCSHYPTCTRPCYPVKQFLKEKGEAFERSGVLYPLYKQIPLSVCMKEADNGKDVANDEEKLLSDELESPFISFKPKLKRTGVFVRRFFLRESYKDIARDFEITPENAMALYRNAVQIILEKLKHIDKDGRKDIADNHYKKMYRKKRNNIPKNMKWYVMANVFGLTPKEIAEIDGNTTNRNVSSAICRVADWVKIEEISLIEFRPEEAKAAKASLDTKRKKRLKRNSQNRK